MVVGKGIATHALIHISVEQNTNRKNNSSSNYTDNYESKKCNDYKSISHTSDDMRILNNRRICKAAYKLHVKGYICDPTKVPRVDRTRVYGDLILFWGTLTLNPKP